MMRIRAALLLFLPATACVGPSASVGDPKNAESALVYGYINGASGVPSVTLANTDAGMTVPWKSGDVPARTYSNGLVMFGNVEPGEYVIDGLAIGKTAYDLGPRSIHLKVRPGQVVYLGAYRYEHEGGLSGKEVTFAPTRELSAQTVREWAAEATEGTGWNPRLQPPEGD